MTNNFDHQELAPIAYKEEPLRGPVGQPAGEPVRTVAAMPPDLTDRPLPAPGDGGASESLAISSDLVEAIDRLGASAAGSDENGSLPWLLAVFAVLLYRYSGEDDILIEIAAPRASGPELNGSQSRFLRGALPLRINLANDPMFEKVWVEVGRGYREIHDDPGRRPGVILLREDPENWRKNNPCFQFEVDLSSASMIDVAQTLAPREGILPSEVARPRNELIMRIDRQHQGLNCTLLFNALLFDVLTVRRMLVHFDVLLRSALANPGERISALALITEAERLQLIEEWSRPPAAAQSPAQSPAFIHEAIARQAARTPEAVAIVFEGRTLTYRQLDDRSNQLAHALRRGGAGPDVIVGISLDRSPELVIGLLGILKAGAAFMPLEPSYPAERLSALLAETRPALLVTDSCLMAKHGYDGTPAFCMDTEREAIAAESSGPPGVRLTEDNLATVMFSSGSTGTPKAIPRSHRSLGPGARTRSPFQNIESDRHLLKTSLDSTLLGREVFRPLLTGGCMIIAGRHENNDATLLLRLITDHKITILTLVPSLLRLLVTEDGFEACTSLRHVTCFGEPLPADVEESFSRSVPAQLSTVYGTTEVPALTVRHCNGPGVRPLGNLGYRFGNAEVYVLDAHLQPVPVDVPGELYAGGSALAEGYLNRHQQTEQRFIPHPFSQKPGARLYRTGDVARWRSDGSLEFMGRLDDQIKIRGYRIEPAEVEAALARHPAVREAVVVARPNSAGENQLVAYLVFKNEPLTVGELRAHLKERLADYMIPTIFAQLSSLPRTPIGKVDRKALPVAKFDRLTSAEAHVAPRSPSEELMARIWCQVLDIGVVGINDDFFDLGGNSLLAIRLFSRIQNHFGLNPPLSTIFKASTIARLAAVIEDTRTAENAGGQPESQAADVLFCLNFGFSLAKFLGSEITVQALTIESDELLFYTVIEEVAAGCVQKMRAIQPAGPYAICAHSVHGLVAYAMAAQLRRHGEEVRLLALIDTFLPPGRFESLVSRLNRFFRRLFRHWWVLVQTPANQWWNYVHSRGRSAKRLVATGSSVIRTPAIGPVDQLKVMYWIYRPHTYSGVVTLFIPEQITRSQLRRHLRTWPKLARGGLDLVRVPGDHESTITEPHVRDLARAIRERMAECGAYQRTCDPGEDLYRTTPVTIDDEARAVGFAASGAKT